MEFIKLAKKAESKYLHYMSKANSLESTLEKARIRWDITKKVSDYKEYDTVYRVYRIAKQLAIFYHLRHVLLKKGRIDTYFGIIGDTFDTSSPIIRNIMGKKGYYVSIMNRRVYINTDIDCVQSIFGDKTNIKWVVWNSMRYTQDSKLNRIAENKRYRTKLKKAL